MCACILLHVLHKGGSKGLFKIYLENVLAIPGQMQEQIGVDLLSAGEDMLKYICLASKSPKDMLSFLGLTMVSVTIPRLWACC